MILKLNSDSTITIEPQVVPEDLDSVYIQYVYPKGLNHLRPVLTWGGVDYEGEHIRIKKTHTNFKMKVTLYNGAEVYKEYYTNITPRLYIGYNVELVEPNLIAYIAELENENRELRERGDIV